MTQTQPMDTFHEYLEAILSDAARRIGQQPGAQVSARQADAAYHVAIRLLGRPDSDEPAGGIPVPVWDRLRDLGTRLLRLELADGAGEDVSDQRRRFEDRPRRPDADTAENGKRSNRGYPDVAPWLQGIGVPTDATGAAIRDGDPVLYSGNDGLERGTIAGLGDVVVIRPDGAPPDQGTISRHRRDVILEPVDR